MTYLEFSLAIIPLFMIIILNIKTTTTKQSKTKEETYKAK